MPFHLLTRGSSERVNSFKSVTFALRGTCPRRSGLHKASPMSRAECKLRLPARGRFVWNTPMLEAKQSSRPRSARFIGLANPSPLLQRRAKPIISRRCAVTSHQPFKISFPLFLCLQRHFPVRGTLPPTLSPSRCIAAGRFSTTTTRASTRRRFPAAFTPICGGTASFPIRSGVPTNVNSNGSKRATGLTIYAFTPTKNCCKNRILNWSAKASIRWRRFFSTGAKSGAPKTCSSAIAST